MLNQAQETWITLRELSRKDGFVFTWSDVRDTYDAISPTSYWQKGAGRNSTLGNLIRAALKDRTVKRIARGTYVFLDVTRFPSPLYVKATDYFGGQYRGGKF
jgi:hypothetical protein